MKKRTVISTEGAPAAIGPYAQARYAVAAHRTVYCSGQIGLDPATGQIVAGGVAEETRRAIANLAAVLEAAGGGLRSVFKTTVFLADMADFAAMNEVYGASFEEPYPARSTVAVAGLPKGARVEIEAIAIMWA